MALVVKDRVKQTTTTTGTGSLVLNGTVDSFQTFASALANGDTTYYAILEPSTNAWEVGLGTWTESTTTLARTTILESSNSGSAINLTAGEAEVFITQPAEKAVYYDANGDITPTGDVDIAGTLDVTGAATFDDSVTIQGDLTVQGTTTTVEATNLAIADNMIYLNDGSSVTNPDLGWAGNYNDGTYAHAGIFRDASDGTFKIYDGYIPEPDAATNIDTTHASFTLAPLDIGALSVEGNVTVTGTVDGRDVAADGSKLDGIEAGATGDQSASEILTAVKTVDGSGSGLDADLLDGQQGSYYLDWTHVTNKPDPSVTLSGDVSGTATMTNLGSINITTTVANDSHTHDSRYYTETEIGNFFSGSTSITGYNKSNWDTAYGWGNHASAGYLAASSYTAADVLTKIKTVDGSGSGLDADLLDGQHGSYYLDWTNTTNKPDPTLTLNGDVSGSATFTDLGNATLTVTVADDSHNHTTANIDNFTESVQDIAGGMWSGNSESGVSVTYQDTDGTLDINVNDPTITLTGAVTGSGTMTNLGNVSIATTATADPTLTLTGDVTGSATFTNLGNATLTATVANDSHTHSQLIAVDDRDMKPNTSGIGSGVKGIKAFFSSYGGMTGTADTDYQDVLVLDTYSDSSGGNANAITLDKSSSAMRIWNAAQGATSWGTPQRVFADNYHPNADKWTTARTLSLTGAVTGSVSWDGSGNASIATTATSDPTLTLSGDASGSATFTNLGNATLSVTIADDSHNHVISNVDGLQTALDGKLSTSGTAANSQLLDSLDSSQFLRSDANDTATGIITFQNSADYQIVLQGTNAWAGIQFDDSGSSTEYLWYNGTYGTFAFGGAGSNVSGKRLHVDGGLSVGASSDATSTPSNGIYSEGQISVGGSTVWHSGNDGSGSGLDADNLDGRTWSTTRNAANTLVTRDGNGYTQLGWINTTSGATTSTINKIYASTDDYIRYVTPATLISQLGLWTSGNDGSGSGLDADTLDGVQGSSFLRSDAADSTSSTISFTGDIQVGDQIFHHGDTNTYMQFHAEDQWRVVTGGTERIEVNNSRTQIDTLLTDAAIGEDYDALSGTSVTADPDAGGAFSLTMTGNTTFTFGAPSLGSGVSTGFIIELTGNGGTVTWPSSVDWAGGTAPDAPASGETDVYVFWTRDGGTTWYGVLSVDAAA